MTTRTTCTYLYISQSNNPLPFAREIPYFKCLMCGVWCNKVRPIHIGHQITYNRHSNNGKVVSQRFLTQAEILMLVYIPLTITSFELNSALTLANFLCFSEGGFRATPVDRLLFFLRGVVSGIAFVSYLVEI